MMQVLTKWKVEVTFEDKDPQILYLHDNFMSNVIRKVGELSFTDFPDPEPLSVKISRIPLKNLEAFTYIASSIETRH